MAANPGRDPFQRETDTTVGQSIHSSPLIASLERLPLVSRGSDTRGSSTSTVRLKDVPTSSIACVSTETLASHRTRSSLDSMESFARNRAPKVLPSGKRRSSLSTPTDDRYTQGTTRDRRWKREISSHLIELRVTRKKSQKESTSTEDIPRPALAKQNQADVRYRYEGPESAGFTSQGQGTQTASLHSKETKESLKVPDNEYSEGLYCRVRRRLGLKKGQALEPDGEKSPSKKNTETERVLNHAAELLRDIPTHRTISSGLSTSTSKSSIAAVHRRKSGQFSTTSSLRNLFMGKEPLSTPESAAFYTGSDNEQYFRVELSGPQAPNFLPSEARRVGTPPLPSGEGHNRPLRGFFFDFCPPGEDEHAESPSWQASSYSGKSSKTSERGSGSSDHGNERDWFRVRVKTFSNQNTFEFDVPDHLPNSPLCARNPKHSSGGKGICPYHGRARTSSMQEFDETEAANKTYGDNQSQ
ncbi:accessory factor associated with RNA polymerase II [Xylographa parallela]|nr:accessory factor associated with RNA polymerase II [Xylographa parallela]